VFDIPLLAERLLHATRWIERELPGVPVGYFGASTGAAAALVAAASGEVEVRAVVSRGGRPDLAGASLPKVVAPTLLVVGGADHPVLEWNVDARRRLGGPSEVAVVPGATHLFEERGALERVVDLAVEWFERYLAHPAPRQPAQPVR
jgi:putative phosphoribosyl transferase